MSAKAKEKPWLPAQGEWTYEDYACLPDDGLRYEVLKGELYMAPAPIPRHQDASRNLIYALISFILRHRQGRVYYAPIDVVLFEGTTVVQPDIIFISSGRADIIGEKYIEGAPDLVVEIISPGTSERDRQAKYQIYEEAGVQEYWLLDPESRTIEVFTLREGIYELSGKWGPGEVARSVLLAGFEVEVDEIFTI